MLWFQGLARGVADTRTRIFLCNELKPSACPLMPSEVTAEPINRTFANEGGGVLKKRQEHLDCLGSICDTANCLGGKCQIVISQAVLDN